MFWPARWSNTAHRSRWKKARRRRVGDLLFAAGFQELVQQLHHALERGRIGIVPRLLPGRKRRDVAAFDALHHRARGQVPRAQVAVPFVQLRGVARILRPRRQFARPDVERGEQAIPKVCRIGIVERQGRVALERAAQWSFPVIPIGRPCRRGSRRRGQACSPTPPFPQAKTTATGSADTSRRQRRTGWRNSTRPAARATRFRTCPPPRVPPHLRSLRCNTTGPQPIRANRRTLPRPAPARRVLRLPP